MEEIGGRAGERRDYLCRRCGARSEDARARARRCCNLCGCYAAELAVLAYPEAAAPRLRSESDAVDLDGDPVTQVRRIPIA